MRNKVLLLLTLALINVLSVIAVPASPELTTWKQTDGTDLSIYVRGDERINWSETIDGYKLLNSKDGNKVYAMLNDNGDMVASGMVAGNPELRTEREQVFLGQVEKDIFFSRRQIESMKENIPVPRQTRDGFPSVGTNNLLMILANFSDTNTQFAQADFDAYMNSENYNGIGSFRDYYHEVSHNQLTVNTVVTEWVTVPWGHDDYQNNWGLFTRHAVDAAEAAGLDFSQFDNDNDGWVDGIAIIHQGPGQEASGDPTDIWSHSSNLIYYGEEVTYDGVTVGAYTSQPEIYNGNISTIGVMCHEFGHNLGAPDFYDTDYETGGSYPGTGQWDLMAGGSWNGSPGGSLPAHHNPLMKQYYGWCEFTDLDQYTDITDITIQNSNEAHDFYIFETTTNNEFYVLENRQQISFNGDVPGHGLIIYHFDEDHVMDHAPQNNLNNTAHQGFYPKAYNGNINSASCPLPGTMQINSFHDWSNPNSLSWAGQPTNKPITYINETVDGDITFSFLDMDIPYTTCEMLEPVTGSIYLQGETVHIVADPWNSLDNLENVEFYINGTLAQTLTEGPWEFDYATGTQTGQLLVGVKANGTDGSWAVDEYYVEIANPITIVAEDFEGFNHGDMIIPNWISLDEDGVNNVDLADFDIPWEGTTGGFGIVDTRTLFPDEDIVAMSGYHTLAAIRADGVNNNDWFISPEVHIDGGSYVQFYQRSYGNQPMKFRVLVSEGSTDPADFIEVSGDSPIEAGADWTMQRVMLTAYTGTDIRIAINCVSDNDSELLLVENFVILSANGAVPNSDETQVPIMTTLEQNYPNPFNPVTSISFNLKEAGDVDLSVYNLLGQKITTLKSGSMNAGRHTIIWHGEDSDNKPVPSGVYFYKLAKGSYTKTRKMLLLK